MWTVAVWDFTSFWQFDIIFCSVLDNHASVKQVCQYKAYKNDKSIFIFKRMLFAKFTQAHAAVGRGICHLL